MGGSAQIRGQNCILREKKFDFDDVNLNDADSLSDFEGLESADQKQAILSKINFINDSFEEDESRFSTVIEKISEMEEENDQKRRKTKPEPEKGSGGFSLFGFMNSKKKSSKNSSSEDDEPRRNSDHQKVRHKTVTRHHNHAKSVREHKLKKEKEVRIDDERDIKTKKHSTDRKKLNQTPEQDDFILEDDMLNVPAFFRRKK